MLSPVAPVAMLGSCSIVDLLRQAAGSIYKHALTLVCGAYICSKLNQYYSPHMLVYLNFKIIKWNLDCIASP